MARPLILFIPGLLPKPRPELHRDGLLRCLIAGLRRIDAPVADAILAHPGNFELIPWTFDFYGTHRDFELDRSSIDALIEQPEANDRDIAEASAWSRRLTRWIYALGDMLPFLIPHLASERMELHLRDLRRYGRNKKGAADRAKQGLKVPLLEAAGSQRPVLLIAHSMGSVIAYDSLWELSPRTR